MTVDADAGRQMQLTYSDVIVMNPPFSRAQSVARFSPNYKEKLEARFSRRERQIHGKMSYFSYFFFLADRFLEEDGRIAVVCPMTVLNKESDHGVREMLVEEYTVEYIFAREDAANYSEDTDFREVLIVARKGCDHEDEGTAFVSHDGFGVDVNEIRATAEEIDVGETAYRDEYTVQCISLDDLNLSNLFAPFSVANPEVLNGWEAVANDIPLTSLQSLRESRPRIRGIGTNADGVMHVHPEASINDPAAHKFDQDDVYVTERETADSVVAKHRHTGDTFSIPRDHLVPNLRRYPGRSKANLSGIPEYAILDDNWDGGNRYMSLTDEPTIPDKWASRVRRRLGHVSLVRRVNLTAPGTHHLAYYSDEKRLYPSTMWVLPPFTSEEAKVLAAWFDSSFGWLQSIVYRTVTEGGMCDWRGYTIDEFRVPQLTSLAGDSDNGGTHQDLIDAFDAVKDIDHPSLAQQLALNAPPDQFSTEQINRMDNAFENISDDLGRGFEARRTLDESILSLAGMPDEQQDDFLDAFYADLFLELVALKRIMDS